MSRGPRRGNLPAAATTFVGRATELAGARDLLAAYRLTTLTGPGGVGKTRLALELATTVASAFPDGVWLVELADLRGPADVGEAAVAALGIGGAAPTGALVQLSTYVAERTLLLVLDNCEHVLAGCQALADRLLRAAPDLRILTTSRQPLGLAGEHIVDVHPLPVPADGLSLADARRVPALALLEDRARAGSPGFALTKGNLAAAAQLCARLDGVPLAIELAAARLRALSVEQLLDRMGDRFATLTGGDPTAGPRHRTLRAMVEWSADLCSPGERSMWARASVFAGGFDLEAAETVCVLPDAATEPRDPAEVLDLVDRLVAKSILLAEPAADRFRYRMLETLAEYGRESLTGSGHEHLVKARHAEHYTRVAVTAAQGFWTGEQRRWLQHARAEHANLAVAFEHMITSPDGAVGALRLATALRFYWVIGGSLREGRRWLERSLDATADAPTPPDLRAEALWSCAWVAVLLGDYAAAQRRLDECDDLCARHDLASAAAHAATWHGTLELFSGDLTRALAHFERAAAAHATSGDVEGRLMTLFQLGITSSLLGDGVRARTACTEAIGLAESVGEVFAGSYAYWVLAHDAWSGGRFDEAEAHARRCLQLKYEVSDTIGIPLAAEVLSGVAVSRGDPVRGARLLGITDAIWESGGTRIHAFGPQLAAIHHDSAAGAVAALGEAAFDAAFAEGRSAPPERVRELLLGEDTTTDGGPTTPEALTSREWEVAELISRGMSNREIASALVLSARTVEGHVQRILHKLGFRSRVEIGVWAKDRA
jgi:predicted ATPase/DNA-binding CsgD family transcriptional regulator